MKRNCIVVLLLLIVLLLPACKPETQLPVNTTDPTVTSASQTIPVTEMDSAAEKTQLRFYMDNNETTADAALFSGEGYSI